LKIERRESKGEKSKSQNVKKSKAEVASVFGADAEVPTGLAAGEHFGGKL
jgi:hypothetical protein